MDTLLTCYIAFNGEEQQQTRQELRVQLTQNMEAAKSELSKIAKAVHQTNMDQGEVDLF